MNFYEKWTDFVSYPGDPQKVRSLEDRIDTSDAMETNEDNVIYCSARQINPGFIRTEREILFREGDEFECTYISDHGQIYIWTRLSVCTLLPEEGDKLVSLERYPSLSPEFETIYGPFKYYCDKEWKNFNIFPNYQEYYSGFAKVRFEKEGSVKASREMIKQLTFSTYPLPENFEDHISRFIKPDIPVKLLVTESEFIDKEDKLETMMIDCVYTPAIWTKKYTCAVRGIEGRERFVILPIHPDVIRG